MLLPITKHLNHGLFSDHYLDELLPKQAGWQTLKADAQAVRDQLWALYTATVGLVEPLKRMGNNQVKECRCEHTHLICAKESSKVGNKGNPNQR